MIEVAGAERALAEGQLTDAEAAELAVLAQGGDQEARDRLAHSLTGLALSIAGTYYRRSEWTADAGELQGLALETLLRYGIDGYKLEAGIPVRLWTALCIRRQLAKLVRASHKRSEAEALWAVEQGQPAGAVEPEEAPPDSELERVLVWSSREGILTLRQTAVLRLRAGGMQFNDIGQTLGLHRKTASREYAAGMEALHRAVEQGLI